MPDITGKEMAERLLHLMQADYENGNFSIEKWTGQTVSDVVLYLQEWLAEACKTITPATQKDYEIRFAIIWCHGSIKTNISFMKSNMTFYADYWVISNEQAKAEKM
jgi:hypothetical protein